MIELLFKKMGDVVLVRIEGNRILFGNTAFGAYLAPIEGLNLSYEGVIKEHPDLKYDPEWREKAINRFKEKISTFKTEDQKASYIIEDLRKHNYDPYLKKQNGFRAKVLS